MLEIKQGSPTIQVDNLEVEVHEGPLAAVAGRLWLVDQIRDRFVYASPDQVAALLSVILSRDGWRLGESARPIPEH